MDTVLIWSFNDLSLMDVLNKYIKLNYIKIPTHNGIIATYKSFLIEHIASLSIDMTDNVENKSYDLFDKESQYPLMDINKLYNYCKSNDMTIDDLKNTRCYMIVDDLDAYKHPYKNQIDQFPTNSYISVYISVRDIVNSGILSNIVYTCNAGW